MFHPGLQVKVKTDMSAIRVRVCETFFCFSRTQRQESGDHSENVVLLGLLFRNVFIPNANGYKEMTRLWITMATVLIPKYPPYPDTRQRVWKRFISCRQQSVLWNIRPPMFLSLSNIPVFCFPPVHVKFSWKCFSVSHLARFVCTETHAKINGLNYKQRVAKKSVRTSRFNLLSQFEVPSKWRDSLRELTGAVAHLATLLVLTESFIPSQEWSNRTRAWVSSHPIPLFFDQLFFFFCCKFIVRVMWRGWWWKMMCWSCRRRG